MRCYYFEWCNYAQEVLIKLAILTGNSSKIKIFQLVPIVVFFLGSGNKRSFLIQMALEIRKVLDYKR
jgi:hypothetical protein